MAKIEETRHSFAHLLAAAVKELFPGAHLGIGPAIDDGFYYDFGNVSITEGDLAKIEKKMRQIARQDHAFKKEEWTKQKAKNHFKKQDQPYKLELIDELPGSKVGIVHTGDVFTDLCRGGHIGSTKNMPLDAFKLMRVAGAYWKGDSERTMLTRIYGVAFYTEKELKDHQKMLEEASKRDHKKLGPKYDLFTFSELVGPGLPLFTPKGTIIRRLLVDFIEDLQVRHGFSQVWIPHITKQELYKTSGHLDKFKDDLFYVKGKEDSFVMKPMNCPHHTQIYKSQQRSYKELPVRYFETTTVYRDEQSGELGGLTRVRSITQDDGHVFCTEDQIEQEFKLNLRIQRALANAVKMKNYWVRLSLRDSQNKEAYLGDDKTWSKAQRQMEDLLKKEKINYKKAEGEAAFYGPKMDFIIEDVLGREWQLSTIQLDLNLPTRFGLEYIDKDGSKRTPIMIHRAFMGSIERFMAMLLEHYAGAFPLWLSPEQVRVIPVSKKHNPYARKVNDTLQKNGIRSSIQDDNETLGKKIREGEKNKTPYIFVVGDEEKKAHQVSMRKRGKGDMGKNDLASVIEQLSKEISQRK